MQPDCRTSAAWSRRARRAPASRTPPWRARWAWASCLAASGSLKRLLLRVRDHAAACAVECVAPQRLDWVRRAAAEGHVLRSALAGADPRAFVAVLGAGAIPTCARERIGDGLGIFVSTDNRESVEVAIAVDEVLPAGRGCVGLVRNVGERNWA